MLLDPIITQTRSISAFHIACLDAQRMLQQDAVIRGRLGTVTHKILDAGVTATALGHLFVMGPMLRSHQGGWALPLATGTWGFIFAAVACQLLTG